MNKNVRDEFMILIIIYEFMILIKLKNFDLKQKI